MNALVALTTDRIDPLIPGPPLRPADPPPLSELQAGVLRAVGARQRQGSPVAYMRRDEVAAAYAAAAGGALSAAALNQNLAVLVRQGLVDKRMMGGHLRYALTAKGVRL